jgi:hypothetical protein
MIVRVGIPSVRNPRPKKTDETIDALKAYDKSKIDFQVFIVTGTHCVRGRNIASMAEPKNSIAPIQQKLPYDYYLSMDDDNAFSPEIIKRLIEADKDVIGAAYPTREQDNYIVGAPTTARYCREDWFKTIDKGLRECLWCGAGCMLIKAKVFESMEYPWWRNNILRVGDQADICTEDVSFCQDVRKAGYKVYIDLCNRAEHV